MPDEGEDLPFSPNSDPELLTTDELLRLMTLFVDLGVRKVRLTGGEPTIRNDLGQIIGHLGELNSRLPEPLSMGITTNGVRLKKFLPHFRDAGFRNINLSLDSLISAKFPLLARKPQEWHQRILRVMEEVAAQEEHFSLKVNCCLLKGVNDDEIGEFVNLTEHLPIEVRFLEFMPFSGNSWSANRLVPQANIVEAMNEHLVRRLGRPAERLPPDSIHDVANLWKVPGWRGRIGIIASMTDAFCGGCNRIRLTSSGEIRNCLFGEEGFSLRDHIREGASDETLTSAITTGVRAKHAKLGGKRDMHELKERGGLSLPMIALGG
jgi:cyclic pyranopterin phosphate synthase